MAIDTIEEDQPPEGTGREPWLTPRLTRFAAAGASAGNAISSADGETDKS